MGAVFEMPIVIFFLSRIGVVTPRFLMRHFRTAVLIIAVLAAVITPTGDMLTMSVFAGPMILLYLLGVLVSWLFGRRPSADDVVTRTVGVPDGITPELPGGLLFTAERIVDGVLEAGLGDPARWEAWLGAADRSAPGRGVHGARRTARRPDPAGQADAPRRLWPLRSGTIGTPDSNG